MILSLFQNIILIIFIVVLSITFVLFIFLIIYVLRLIRISTKLKAKQFEKFNGFAMKSQIVFLGDSLTEFYQIEEFFHGYPVYNRGIASDTTDGVLERLDSNVIEIQPKKVFIQIGTNDYRARKNNDYIFKNIKNIVTKLKENLPEVKVYIISLYPVNHKAKIYSRFFTSPRKNKNIIELNQMLKNYCSDNNIPFINVYDELIDKDGNLDKQYTVEGLHISYEGYEVITKILKPYLEE